MRPKIVEPPSQNGSLIIRDRLFSISHKSDEKFCQRFWVPMSPDHDGRANGMRAPLSISPSPSAKAKYEFSDILEARRASERHAKLQRGGRAGAGGEIGGGIK